MKTYALVLPSDDPPAPRLVGVKTATTILSLSRSTVYALVRSGELRTVRIGRRVLIPVEAIDDFIAQLKHNSGIE